MQAYEGYYENGHFYQFGKAAPLTGRRRAVFTVLDEPVQDNSESENAHAGAWKEFFEAINAIDDEPVPEFERVTFREREV